MTHLTRSTFAIIIPALLALPALSASAQSAKSAKSDYRLRGWYLRGGTMSFDRALILNWDERQELMVNQAKGMPSFGAGYAFLPRNFWGGVNVGVQYMKTTLDPFTVPKYIDSNLGGAPNPTLKYSAVDYSMFLFDLDGYVAPSPTIPVALTLGVVMGGSLQSYTVSDDVDPALSANGSKSMNIFRYGYKVGVKIMPWRFVSVDLEYRPMAGYTTTTHYTDFLYYKDGYNYYGSAHETAGPSERLIAMSLSIHF